MFVFCSYRIFQMVYVNRWIWRILEKIFEASEDDESQNNNKGDEKRKKIIGYLNLAANCIDNFIHGLAVASR